MQQSPRAKRGHPYLSGNFAPIQRELPLTPCNYEGDIPDCLAGGEYVRNGGNPLKNDDLGRDAHWFDGDGMLTGVLFRRTKSGIQPEFVNTYVLTDVYLSSATTSIRTPLLPSISSLMNPLSSFIEVLWHILRALTLIFLSQFSKHVVKRISVANTSILFFDNRALATCESGPPMRILLPQLQTVGWFDGTHAEGESDSTSIAKIAHQRYGDNGLLGWMREWTTAHPRVDPLSGELISFHSSFLPPYIRYSVVPSETKGKDAKAIFNAPVRGIKSPKMTHDFGVSHLHTVILDLPLSLDPLNMVKGKPILSFDAHSVSRYAVFPRHQPDLATWYEEPEPCVIFHTANTWDKVEIVYGGQEVVAVSMLSCRLNSGVLAYSAGNLCAPPSAYAPDAALDVCQLYYHEFSVLGNKTRPRQILRSFPLLAIPFEFPSIAPKYSMQFARYVYGCSLYSGNFSAALGRAAKIDCLVKVDVHRLLQVADSKSSHLNSKTPCDGRSIAEILETGDSADSIVVFRLPEGWYAQEMAFVPRTSNSGTLAEDDGYLLVYVFDEFLGLDARTGCAMENAASELWIFDARNMKDVVCKITLPQRVPYGLHGTFFTEHQVQNQKPVETVRQFAKIPEKETRL